MMYYCYFRGHKGTWIEKSFWQNIIISYYILLHVFVILVPLRNPWRRVFLTFCTFCIAYKNIQIGLVFCVNFVKDVDFIRISGQRMSYTGYIPNPRIANHFVYLNFLQNLLFRHEHWLLFLWSCWCISCIFEELVH